MKSTVTAAPLLFDLRNGAAYIGVSLRMMEEYVAQGVFPLVRLPRPDGKGYIKKNLIKREALDTFVRERGKPA